MFSWDGKTRTYGRSYVFNQDIAHLPLVAAWRDTRSNVLAMYGESDVVALHGEDHRLIADIVDFHRPGTGRFVDIPSTDHGMELVGNRSELRRRTIAAGEPPSGPFNVRVAEVLAEWIATSLETPPVRTLPTRTRLPGPAPQHNDYVNPV
ncbi:MAG TPA: hypothetical protein VEZ48_01665 [Sphingomonadaceae bacterium]|nr:hypothetical protein [Sphingomonadaceae bacterium]